MKSIAIIGGGISGLAAAHRLLEVSNKPLQIILIEANNNLGGTIQTEELNGFLLERGPDSFISEKPAAVSLARRLGIESRLIQTNEEHRRSFIVNSGKLKPVPEGFQLLAPSRIWPFVTTDIFSFSGKLRMAGDLLLPRKSANGLGDESLASFVRRRLGNEALERMAQPMIGGIYTADPEKLSLRATLPRFLDMERDSRSLILAMWRKGRGVGRQTGVSGPRYSLFLSFDRGMQVLVEALEQRLSRYEQLEVRRNTRVTSLERTTNQKWQVVTSDATIICDAVCLAVPSYIAASLLQSSEPQLAAQLNKIKFASTATINLAYKREDIGHKLDGFGFVVPFVEKRSILACTFSSVKFSGRAPSDHVLLRAFVGGALQANILELTDEEIITRVENDLRELVNITGQPLFTELSRWTNAMPQYEVGHLDRIGEIEGVVSNLKGLALAGNSYRGAGIPDCIKSGETAAEKLTSQLGHIS